jgi:hypothetical protein
MPLDSNVLIESLCVLPYGHKVIYPIKNGVYMQNECKFKLVSSLECVNWKTREILAADDRSVVSAKRATRSISIEMLEGNDLPMSFSTSSDIN